MDLLSLVKSNIEKHRMISPGDTILAGISGGPDSVALLHLLYRLKDELRYRVCAGHLNHMFRGEEAEADARLAEELARSWDIPFVAERFNVPEYIEKQGLSPQQGAREVRYRFFREAAAKFGAGRVALGHHADDQAETVLINLIRGAGVAGLGGIPPVRGGFYIRPLLTARRKQIEEYCRCFRLPYREDSSNLKTVYLRNRIRLELIPLLEEKYNPAVVDTLNRLAGIAQQEDQYMNSVAMEALMCSVMSREEGKTTLSIEKMDCYPVAVRRRILRAACVELAGEGSAPGAGHVERALEMAFGSARGGKVEFPGGIHLVKKGRVLEMAVGRNIPPVPPYRYALRVPGHTYIPEVGRGIEAKIINPSGIGDPRRRPPDEACLDLDKLNGPLGVRRREEGDVFSPLGMKGTMKLKKFLIERKVPKEARDAIPIVTCGNDIVWVAGIRPGEQWKITGSTRKCLHLALTED